jgi:hypothetical protein
MTDKLYDYIYSTKTCGNETHGSILYGADPDRLQA